MTHAVIEAAAQFQNDERGRKRKRMTPEQRRDLERTLNAMNVQRHDPIDWARRGEAVTVSVTASRVSSRVRLRGPVPASG